jgi:hypothetical protein
VQPFSKRQTLISHVPLLDEAFDVLLVLEPIVVLIQIVHPCVQLSRLLFGSLRFLLLIVDEIRRVVLLIIILMMRASASGPGRTAQSVARSAIPRHDVNEY